MSALVKPYDPAKFCPLVVYRLGEGSIIEPSRIIYLRAEPDLDDLIGMDDPNADPLSDLTDYITAPLFGAYRRWLS